MNNIFGFNLKNGCRNFWDLCRSTRNPLASAIGHHYCTFLTKIKIKTLVPYFRQSIGHYWPCTSCTDHYKVVFWENIFFIFGFIWFPFQCLEKIFKWRFEQRRVFHARDRTRKLDQKNRKIRYHAIENHFKTT